MLCLSGFELYSPWVPLKNADINDEKEYSLLEEAGVETFL